MRLLKGILAAAVAVALASPALAHHKPGHEGGPKHGAAASGKAKAKGNKAKHDAPSVVRDSVGGAVATAAVASAIATGAVTAQERDIILSWLGDHRGVLADDVKPLPPGIAKNLERGKPLPPGIAKRYLPEDLRLRLPARPGYEWLVVDRDIVLVDAASRVIAGMIAGAL